MEIIKGDIVMNNIHKILYNGMLLSATVAAMSSCHEIEYPEHSAECQMNSIYMNVRVPDIDPAKVSYKAVDGVIDDASGTITFDVPYNISEVLDDVTDLSKVFLIASAPVGASITPPLGGLRDMTTDLPVTVTAASGDTKDYVISARLKKSSANSIVSFKFSIGDNTFEGIPDDNSRKVTYMVATPDLREIIAANPAVAEVKVSNRAEIISPDFSKPVDFSQDVKVVVEAQDGSRAEWTIVQSEPVILDYGFGYTRMKWSITSDQMGISGSGDYRSVTVTSNYFVVQGRYQDHLLFDKETGAKVGTVKIPSDYDADKCASMYATVDAAGKLCAGSFPSWSTGSNFNLVYWKDGETEEPVRLIKKAGLGDCGRKLAVIGDLSANAVVYVTSGKGNSVFKFYIEGGVWNQEKDEKVTIADRTFTYLCTPCPLGTSADSDFILVDQVATGLGLVTLHKADGTLKATMADGAMCANGNVTGDGKVFTFNNATYLMYSELANSSTKARIRIYDITNIDNFTMASTNPLFGSFLVFQSDWISSTSNGNGTGSVAVEVAPDGETANVYQMLTSGDAVKYELTKIGL